MLVIRIAAITLASDSAITIARFRPSKPLKGDFGKGGCCRHDFMKACFEGVQVTHSIEESTEGGQAMKTMKTMDLHRLHRYIASWLQSLLEVTPPFCGTRQRSVPV